MGLGVSECTFHTLYYSVNLHHERMCGSHSSFISLLIYFVSPSKALVQASSLSKMIGLFLLIRVLAASSVVTDGTARAFAKGDLAPFEGGNGNFGAQKETGGSSFIKSKKISDSKVRFPALGGVFLLLDKSYGHGHHDRGSTKEKMGKEDTEEVKIKVCFVNLVTAKVNVRSCIYFLKLYFAFFFISIITSCKHTKIQTNFHRVICVESPTRMTSRWILRVITPSI